MNIAFPVVALTADNTFLHVFPEVKELREHVVEDIKVWARTPGAAPDPDRELEFFDSRGRRLAPRLGPFWVLVALEVADDTEDEPALLARMEAAARHAEEVERERRRAILAKTLSPAEIALRLTESPSAPLPVDATVLAYAELILATRDDIPDGTIPGDVHSGGWMHNAWHAAFG